ncbi:MAG: hypothetical protein J0H61_06600, partial [Alphaproteobacteria bacterium]|nr:hypothetical protein [Alphaproteobacteria bacterium]
GSVMPQKQGFRASTPDAWLMARAAPSHAAPQSTEALWRRGGEFHGRNAKAADYETRGGNIRAVACRGSRPC